MPKPFYVRSAVMVTNLSVHFKLGRESSLVWVTQLDNAAPVANAAVAVRDCGGATYWEGRTDASGIARVNKGLPARDGLPSCGIEDAAKEFFVTAHTDDDTAFAFSNWGEGIAPWRFNVPTGNWNGPYVAHAVLDRSLVRAGETVSMKLFVRQQTAGGFALPPRKGLEDTLLIRHVGSEKEYEVPVKWTGTGAPASGEATFAVPKDAYLGSYQVLVHDTLAPHAKEATERLAGVFRVEAFRVPLLRARMQAVGTPLVRPTEVNLDIQVNYLSGGGAGGLPATLRTQVDAKQVGFPDYDDFAFAAGNVKEGREEQGDNVARFDGFAFADPDMDEPDATGAARPQRGTALPLTLDKAGGARATVRDVQPSEQPQDMLAELEYRDPNGETLTAATRVALWPAKLVLGIKPDGWAAAKDRIKFTVVAVDLDGKPLPGVRVRTDAFKRDYFSHRRRLIGGFYAYEHGYDTARVGDLCQGETDRLGLLICEMPAPATGNLILRAQAADADGRAVVTRTDAWVATDDDQWFAGSDNDRIDLLPEKKRYEPGTSARFQVRTPFKDATVLVTVEREGVLDAFVQTIARNDPVLDVPMKGNYAPNVFVSALRGARAHRRRRADGARRPREAGVQDGSGRSQGGLAGPRARGEGHAGARGVQGARQGIRDDRRAPPRRQRAARGQRSGAGRRRRGPARTAAQRFVETAGRDDDAPRRRSGDGHRADAGDRQAPLRPQGDRAGRRRRARVGARALRHAAAVAGARAARRGGQRDGRDSAERFADVVPHRRGRRRPARSSSAPARRRSARRRT